MAENNLGIKTKFPTFEDAQAEWEKQTAFHLRAGQQINSALIGIDEQVRTIEQQAVREQLDQVIPASRALLDPYGQIGGLGFIDLPRPDKRFTNFEELNARMGRILVQGRIHQYYFDLYTTIPRLISNSVAVALEEGGADITVDDILQVAVPPDVLDEFSRNQINDIIQGMIDVFVGVRYPVDEPFTSEQLDEVDRSELKLDALVAPVRPSIKPTVTIATVSEIRKQLVQSIIPISKLTDDNWEDVMKGNGLTDADLELVNFARLDSQRIVEAWQEQIAANDAFDVGMRELPPYRASEILAAALISPAQPLLLATNWYFERVSQPLAGILWGSFGVGDIEAQYREYVKAGDSRWQAAGKAWEDWDGNWALKYLVMEAVVDPLSYLGWGIATKITRPLGAFGRLVGTGERAFTTVMELPFDLIKTGIKRLPLSMIQRAGRYQAVAGQTVERYMESFTGRPLSFMSMEQWDKGVRAATRAARQHPQSDTDMVRAGMAFLHHEPIGEDLVRSWARQLKSGLSAEEITRVTIDNVDDIFEQWFTKRIGTAEEVAGRILSVLDAADIDDVTRSLARKLVNARADRLNAGARAYGVAKSPHAAMRAFQKASYRTYVNTEKSAASLVRMEHGRYASLLDSIGGQLSTIWRDQVERKITRPFAEAYLTFGMYGPMNVLEDYFRSALGGVFPHRMTNEQWDLVRFGLNVDPQLSVFGLQEQLGTTFVREGTADQFNNWVIQLAALGQKGWGDKIQKFLVRLPGGVGMDIRRNFVASKYIQILSENGGEALTKLMRMGPELPGNLDKHLVKSIDQVITRAKVSGNPDMVRSLKQMFTRKKIMRNEIDTILKEHPNLSNNVRDRLMQFFDEDTLFNTAVDVEPRFAVVSNIDNRINDLNNVMLDDFIRGPQMATKQFTELSDKLVEFGIENPVELAQSIMSLNRMSELFGATPKQIMAQVTVRSRGLPLPERVDAFNIAFDDMSRFMESASQDIERVVNNLRERLTQPLFGDDVLQTTIARDANKLFDDMVALNQKSADFRRRINSWRSDQFAGKGRGDLGSDFWDSFYIQLDHQYDDFNTAIAGSYGKMLADIEQLSMSAGVRRTVRPPLRITDRPLSPNDIAMLIETRGDDVSRALLETLTVQNDRAFFIEYVLSKTRADDVGFSRSSIGDVYDQILHSMQVSPEDMNWISGAQRELNQVRNDLHVLHNSKLYPEEDIARIGSFFDETADAMDNEMFDNGALRPEFEGLQDIRQNSMDEAHKWYQKEYTDYSNANAFDSMMKQIYPFWTYESQRWFWVPRSFVRHPGVLAQWGRWQNNTDRGYIPIVGTSMEWNIARGTVGGVLSTRLMQRDYPEYYDQLEGASKMVEFSDALSRYGFYPGPVFSITLAALGGLETQMGETIPAIWKTPLNLLVGMFPDNEAVKLLSDKIFNDRFRDYMTIQEVLKLGGDGLRIWTKRKLNEELTPAENQMWTDARSYAAYYGAAFEQFGVFRLRSEEKRQIFDAVTELITEWTGFTAAQQDEARRRGIRIWDLVGGMSPAQQEVLKELDYYRWIGTARPLLPGREQLELNRLDQDWADVEEYTVGRREAKTQLEQEFLNGTRGPDAYLAGMRDESDKIREFIDQKMIDNPLMTLEGRTEYALEKGRTMPVQSPFNELINLYFSIELLETVDPATGEIVRDWDSYWGQREAIEDAIPDDYKADWQQVLSKNSTPTEELRADINKRYFIPYNSVWEVVLGTYTPEEQALLKELFSLERLGSNLPRQEEIKRQITGEDKLLVSDFRREVSAAKKALRFVNPMLDAWLFYWGKVTSFATPEARQTYNQIARNTGRNIGPGGV